MTTAGPRCPPSGQLGLVAVLACAAGAIAPGAARPLPPHREIAVDTTPKARPRMMPPEVYLRAYLTWFGGLAPLDVQARACGRALFDAWDDYLDALDLPDYRLDLPRQTQTNTLMLAAFGRLGKALCVRAAEHDLHDKKTPADARVVFAFEPVAHPTAAQFRPRQQRARETPRTGARARRRATARRGDADRLAACGPGPVGRAVAPGIPTCCPPFLQ